MLKTVPIRVRNADVSAQTVRLSVDAGDCPSGVAGTPDFDPRPEVVNDTIRVPAGKTKTAKMPLHILSGSFRTFNHKAPTRCHLRVVASAVVPGGSNDPRPSNNAAVLELNVVDKNDAEQTVRHETTIRSAKPVAIAIPHGETTVVSILKVIIGNADYRPAAEDPGDPITLIAATSCTGLSMSAPVCDPQNLSDTATVKCGRSKTCKIIATANAAQINTPNALSPQRCTVLLTAAGPSHPETAPLDASNNTAEFVVDMVDRNLQ